MRLDDECNAISIDIFSNFRFRQHGGRQMMTIMKPTIVRKEETAMAIKKKILHQTAVTAMRTMQTSLEIANFAYVIYRDAIVKEMHL